MLEDFDAMVGRPNGIVSKVQLDAAERRQLISQAFEVLQANSGLQDDVLATLLKPHFVDPLPLIDALHLPGVRHQSQARAGQFVKTMTKPAKTRKVERAG
jgi:hypothetical protein